MLYLASASPRRAELLRQVGIAFEVMPSDLEEQPGSDERPRDYVERVATEKAQWVAARIRSRGLPDRPVLGADTEVILDGDILGKPYDATHGLAMLRRLAGRRHQVLSAIAVVANNSVRHAVCESFVTFGPMTDEAIRDYWESGEPADKAGGYAVQGLAARYIRHIEGSFSGIVGLPLFELEQLLKEIGYRRP